MVTKTYILQEIKRTAEANGGKPLGSRKFESETGIKWSDWERYWGDRWSDALREAGHIPNQLVAAYDSKGLLDRYAQLAQQLGRLPTTGDLRLKAHNDPAFPAASTFHRKFDKHKSNLVKHLLEYCQSRNKYDDVIRLCKEYAPRKQNVSDEFANREEEIGFVYLIKSGRYYKIGRSNSAGRREYELAIQLPEKAKSIYVIRTDDPSGIEAYWHKRFDAKRKNGEWFALNATDVAAFRRRKFQ